MYLNKIKLGIVIIVAVSITMFFVYNNIGQQGLSSSQDYDYYMITDYSIKQTPTMDIFEITTNGKIPQNLSEFEFSNDILGFGYILLWEDNNKHLGSGHAKGYVVNIHKGDPLGDRWHVEFANVEILEFSKYGFDFCFSDLESYGNVVMDENNLTVNTRPSNTEITNDDFVLVSSFHLYQESICHSGFGGDLIRESLNQ